MIDPARRDRVVKELTRHCGDGRLTLDELEQRIESAFAAETDDDLRALLADLPATGAIEPVPEPRPATPPAPPRSPEPRVGLDAAKTISTVCAVGGFVLLFNGMLFWAIIVWFVVPGLLIHDRRR